MSNKQNVSGEALANILNDEGIPESAVSDVLSFDSILNSSNIPNG